MTTSTKVSSFTILKTKNQFILLCWKKKIWRMCTNFWINPHNGKLPSRLAPAQYQNSLTPQLLSNIYWSKTKTSISLNRVYWYDTMCHIFSCYIFILQSFDLWPNTESQKHFQTWHPPVRLLAHIKENNKHGYHILLDFAIKSENKPFFLNGLPTNECI